MTKEQLIEALIGQLLIEGVTPEQVERAVSRVRDLRWGHNVVYDYRPGRQNGRSLLSYRRAFAFEQAKLLESAL
jgi:hypothetical protein